MERRDMRRDGLRTADDRDLVHPAFGIELVLGGNPALHLLAGAAVAGSQLLGGGSRRNARRFIGLTDNDKTPDRHLGCIAAGIFEGANAAAQAVDGLLAALKQRAAMLRHPSRTLFAIG